MIELTQRYNFNFLFYRNQNVVNIVNKKSFLPANYCRAFAIIPVLNKSCRPNIRLNIQTF